MSNPHKHSEIDDWRTVTSYRQRTVHLEGDIFAPASLVWQTLTNWGGLFEWFNSVPDPIYPVVSGNLLPGQSESDLPRIRRAVFDLDRLTGVVPEEINDAAFVMPPYVDEVLLLADETALFMAYSYSDNFHPGITTIQLIELGPSSARFIIKYTTLESADMAKLDDAPSDESSVGYAFHDKADYRALKFYCEQKWSVSQAEGR